MPQEQPANDNEMKQQAIRRVLIAIALIMVAIVVLNALSRLKESQQKVLTTNKEPSVASAAITAPTKEIVASVIEKPASIAATPEPVASTPSELAVASHPAPPVVNNANGYVTPPSSTPNDQNSVTTIENLPGTPLALPAKPTTKPPAVTATPSVVAPSVVTPVMVAPEKSAKAIAAPVAPAPASSPKLPTASNTAPALSVQSYTVQAGVFGQYENANMLYQKLKDQGIPVRLESRVVVGPFKDKSAAAAAQRELESLGIKPVVIPNVMNNK